MNRIVYTIIFLIIISSTYSCKDKNKCNTDTQKINQLQYLGSHNSFRIKTYQPIFDFVIGISAFLPDDLNPEAWDYNHVPIPEQLNDYNVRCLEIDVFYDPDGGLFYNRQGNTYVGENAESGIPELLEPGFKVLHIPDVDYMTHHHTFKDLLITVKDWSDNHKNHEPLFIMIEPEAHTVAEFLPGGGFAESLPITTQALIDLEQEVIDIFGENLNGIFTPDELRGSYNTVQEAVLAGNWPTLREAKGNIIFIVNETDKYKNGNENLEGKAMFIFTEPNDPACAFIKRDNPISSFEDIQNLVRQGYFIRTRSDSDTKEARSGDTSRKYAAFESGAHLISTDYYKADPRAENSNEWSDFSVQLSTNKAFQLNCNNTTCICD